MEEKVDQSNDNSNQDLTGEKENQVTEDSDLGKNLILYSNNKNNFFLNIKEFFI